MKWSELDIDRRDKLAYATARVLGISKRKGFGMAGRVFNTWGKPTWMMCCLARLDYRIKSPGNLAKKNTFKSRVTYLQDRLGEFTPSNTSATGGDDIAWNDGPDAFNKYYHMIMPEQEDKSRHRKDFTSLMDLMNRGK